MFLEIVVFPTPFEPTKIRFVASLRNSRVMRASTAPRSQRFGQFQSNSSSALKRPSCAPFMRRSRLRRICSCSSHCNKAGNHGASAISAQCASSPCSRNACARLRNRSEVVVIISLRERVVAVKSLRLHGGIFCAYVIGKGNVDRWWLMARFAPAFEDNAHRMGMRRTGFEGFLDGGLQFGCTVPVEQTQ